MSGLKWRSVLAGLVAGAMLMGAVPSVAAVGDAVLQGRSNKVDRRTTIRGDAGTSATLLLINDSTAGSGLAVRVASGNAPLRVNSRTRVDNLNADLLDGRSGSEFASKKARPGDLLIGAFGAAGESNFLVHAATFTPQLPIGVPQSRIHYVQAGAGTTAECPGQFSATPGYLCIYAAWENHVTFSGIGRIESQILNSGAGRYGFTILWSGNSKAANVRGNWAYRVPAAADASRSNTESPIMNASCDETPRSSQARRSMSGSGLARRL